MVAGVALTAGVVHRRAVRALASLFRAAPRAEPAVTTLRSRLLGAFLFMAGLAAILAVSLART